MDKGDWTRAQHGQVVNVQHVGKTRILELYNKLVADVLNAPTTQFYELRISSQERTRTTTTNSQLRLLPNEHLVDHLGHLRSQDVSEE